MAVVCVLWKSGALVGVPTAPLLLLLLFIQGAGATCPHCFGNFASCTFDSDAKCPAVDVVTANAAVVAAGAGVLTLTNIIKPKFLRMFSKSTLDSLLVLLKRPMPGTVKTITATTKGTEILSAISYGQLTHESALFQLAECVCIAWSLYQIRELYTVDVAQCCKRLCSA